MKMAWNNYNSDEGKYSEYNTASLKMKRLSDETSEISQINGNLLAFNQDYGVYNFELKLSKLDNLYLEVESKLNEKERKDIESFRKVLHLKIKKNLIFVQKKKPTYPYTRVAVTDEKVWDVIVKWLFEYERKVRGLLDEHGLDTKYEDESALF